MTYVFLYFIKYVVCVFSVSNIIFINVFVEHRNETNVIPEIQTERTIRTYKMLLKSTSRVPGLRDWK